MNLPRQGKPTRIMIEGGDVVDREALKVRIIRAITNNGDDATSVEYPNAISIRHYPRAVND